jgi:VWFA-related protein
MRPAPQWMFRGPGLAQRGRSRFKASLPDKVKQAMRAATILVSISLLAAALAAQNPVTPARVAPQNRQAPAQTPRQQPPVISATTRLVIVPVTVKDSRGQLVAGLTREDFAVLDDNVKRDIVSFSADPRPISAVVLLDNDLGDKQAKQVQASLETISAAFGGDANLGGQDEVALVTYDQFPRTTLDFTKDNDQLYTQLKRLQLGSHSTFVYPDPATSGPTNPQQNPTTPTIGIHGPPKYQNTSFLDDALYAAGQMLKDRGNDRRKIIFLVSDGSNARDNKHPFDETLTSLLEGDVSVYSISVTHTVPLGKSLVQHGASELENYAQKTGGDTFFAAKQQDLDHMYSTLTEEARNEYTLTFEPDTAAPDQAAQARDYHEIEVRILNHPGLNILTRDGYYLSAVTAGH